MQVAALPNRQTPAALRERLCAPGIQGVQSGIEVAATSTLGPGGVARAGVVNACAGASLPASESWGTATRTALRSAPGHSQLQRDLFTTAVGVPVLFRPLALGTTWRLRSAWACKLRRTDLTHQAPGP